MITPKQRQVMLVIEAEHDAGRPCPSVREIATRIKLRSTSGVVRLLRGLEERGFIRRAYARPRCIEIIRPVSRFEAMAWDDASQSVSRRIETTH